MTTKTRMKEVCSILGSAFSLREADTELAIYRDYGNNYEVIITSGNNRKRDQNFWLDVRHKNQSAPVKMVRNITCTADLKRHLDEVFIEYVRSQA